jgi:hypothetical protein
LLVSDTPITAVLFIKPSMELGGRRFAVEGRMFTTGTSILETMLGIGVEAPMA